uniref:GM04775p n=1 Tax=Drosophila melanogaster TaxID=7227 RepID=Q95S99_DROME|nr:GM04775p [Drosophila melanogaster]
MLTSDRWSPMPSSLLDCLLGFQSPFVGLLIQGSMAQRILITLLRQLLFLLLYCNRYVLVPL